LEAFEDRLLPATVFTVTSTGNDPAVPGTLAFEINHANSGNNPADVINFAIGNAVETIQPSAGGLPAVTAPVTIDATAPGSMPKQFIVLDGVNAGTTATGLDIQGGNTLVRGAGRLEIIRFGNAGVLFEVHGGDKVTGCFLGTDAGGALNLGNMEGIIISGASGNTIGGSSTGTRNIISGNGADGVLIDGAMAGARNNVVAGNYIGIDPSGTQRLANGNDGVLISGGFGTTIGGATSAAANLISGNLAAGVDVEQGSFLNSGNNVVLNNYIGINAGFNGAIGNAVVGVRVGGAANTAIHGNVISGNGDGISLSSTPSAGTFGTTIQSNFIGTDITGAAAIPNTGDGIFIQAGVTTTTIGSHNASAFNVISGNNGDGVHIIAPLANPTSTTIIEGLNRIGTDVRGIANLGNLANGVHVEGAGVMTTTIGPQDAAAMGNIIAYNGASGVLVDGSPGAAIQSNSIFLNGNLGIRLINGGNNNQTAPTLTGANSNTASVAISGSISGAANTNYTVQFFSNPVSDPSGAGQGQTYLGAAVITTNGMGQATFTATTQMGGVPDGQFVSATAADPNGNTSAFADNVSAANPLTGTTFYIRQNGEVWEATGSGHRQRIDINAVQVSMGIDSHGAPAAFILYNNSFLYEWSPNIGFALIDVNVAQVSAFQGQADTVFIRYIDDQLFRHMGSSHASGFLRIVNGVVDISAGTITNRASEPDVFLVDSDSRLYEWSEPVGFTYIDFHVAVVSASQAYGDTVFIRYVDNLVYEHVGTSTASGFTRIDVNGAQVSAGISSTAGPSVFIRYGNGVVYEWSAMAGFQFVDINAVGASGDQDQLDAVFILYNNGDLYEAIGRSFHLVDHRVASMAQ
jgi:parallel beta-helix repeat protein